MKLGHVHLKVRDLERSRNFYRQLVGVQETEQVGGVFSFLSFGAAHHDLALQALGPRAEEPNPEAVGLYHVAFEVENDDELRGAAGRLKDGGVPYVAVDHGISKALYFSDPDGNGVEVYLDTRTVQGSHPYWDGQSRRMRSI